MGHESWPVGRFDLKVGQYLLLILPDIMILIAFKNSFCV